MSTTTDKQPDISNVSMDSKDEKKKSFAEKAKDSIKQGVEKAKDIGDKAKVVGEKAKEKAKETTEKMRGKAIDTFKMFTDPSDEQQQMPYTIFLGKLMELADIFFLCVYAPLLRALKDKAIDYKGENQEKYEASIQNVIDNIEKTTNVDASSMDQLSGFKDKSIGSLINGIKDIKNLDDKIVNEKFENKIGILRAAVRGQALLAGILIPIYRRMFFLPLYLYVKAVLMFMKLYMNMFKCALDMFLDGAIVASMADELNKISQISNPDAEPVTPEMMKILVKNKLGQTKNLMDILDTLFSTLSNKTGDMMYSFLNERLDTAIGKLQDNCDTGDLPPMDIGTMFTLPNINMDKFDMSNLTGSMKTNISKFLTPNKVKGVISPVPDLLQVIYGKKINADANGNILSNNGKIVGKKKNILKDSTGTITGQEQTYIDISDAYIQSLETREKEDEAEGINTNGKNVDGSGNPVPIEKKSESLKDKMINFGKNRLIKYTQGKKEEVKEKVTKESIDEIKSFISKLKVDDAGKVYDETNEYVGQIRKVIENDGNKIVGMIVPMMKDSAGKLVQLKEKMKVDELEGVIRDQYDDIIGKVQYAVNNEAGELLGETQTIIEDIAGNLYDIDKGEVINKAGDIIAEVNDVVRDKAGEILEYVDKETVKDATGKVIGKVDTIYRDAEGALKELDVKLTINEANQVVDDIGNVVGDVVKRIKDDTGKVIQYIDKGELKDAAENVIGSVQTVVKDTTGNIVKLNGEIVAKMSGDAITKLEGVKETIQGVGKDMEDTIGNVDEAKDIAKGVGSAVKDTAEDAAEDVIEGVGEVAKGVGSVAKDIASDAVKGIDKGKIARMTAQNAAGFLGKMVGDLL